MAENKSNELTESANVESHELSKCVRQLNQLNNMEQGIVARPTTIKKMFESSSAIQTAIGNAAMAAIVQPSAIRTAFESLNGYISAFGCAATIASSAQPSATRKAFEALSKYRSVIDDKAMAAITQPSATQEKVQSLVAYQSAIGRAAMAITQPSATQKAFESLLAYQSAIGRVVMAAIPHPFEIEKTFDAFSSHQRIIESAMASISNYPAMGDVLASFVAASTMILREPTSLSAILASIEDGDFPKFEAETFEADLTQAANKLNNASSQTSLLSVFWGLPQTLKIVFVFILLQILLPQVNSISANFLTPIAESYLLDNNLTDKEKIKKIKNIPLHLDDVTTEGLRFITGNNVRLRSEPTTKSEILDELLLGQVVTVISKDRNWIEVTYTHVDGETMSGWVFTRYTAKFVR